MGLPFSLLLIDLIFIVFFASFLLLMISGAKVQNIPKIRGKSSKFCPKSLAIRNIRRIFAPKTKRQEMNKRKLDIAYFLSFCIEQYKKEKGISGAEAVRILKEQGVLEYLKEHFEVLHTQSKQWLLADIDEFIKLRKEAGHETLSR